MYFYILKYCNYRKNTPENYVRDYMVKYKNNKLKIEKTQLLRNIVQNIYNIYNNGKL